MSASSSDKATRVVVTGAGGMLGSALCRVLPGEPNAMEVVGLARRDLDVTREQDVSETLKAIRPDAVIHTAAFTLVDRCEEEPELARRVNALGTAHVARVCRALSCRLIYVSTDYVFDGRADRPYRVDDPPAPLGVYGATKWEGEEAVRRDGPQRFLIGRTSWVYGPGGRNFVDAILEKGMLGEPLRVVTDQCGSPTYSVDLAEGLKALLVSEAVGVVHVTGGGSCTWFDFARQILAAAGLNPDQVEPTTARSLGRRAPRPAYSVLDGTRFREWTGRDMRPWPEALRDYLAQRGALARNS